MRASGKQDVLVGMGGWQLEPFDGVFYPTSPGKRFRRLEFYSRFFDMVEVNATFYSTDFSGANALRWLDDVSGNKEFIFSVKLFKGFTHSYDATQQDVRRVHALLDPIAAEGKLAGLVMQFPYSFLREESRFPYLAKLSKAFEPYRMFIEVRHNSWNKPDVRTFFEDNRLHPINVDLPQIKKHMPLTDVAWDGVSYFRMMGRNGKTWDRGLPTKPGESSDRYLYRYSDQELEDLFALINGLGRKSEDTFVVFHNDPQANSLYNGFKIRHLVSPKRQLNAPPKLLKAFPDLKAFVNPVEEASPLFAGRK